MARRPANPTSAGWYLLIHQLPPEPLYLRAKIRQRLSKVGAVALKNAVYVLPRTEDCLEDFEWIAQEAIGGKGEAHVCEARFLGRETDTALIERFRRERDADYAALSTAIRECGRSSPGDDLSAHLARGRKRFAEIVRIDFFKAPGRLQVERLLETLSRRGHSRRPPIQRRGGALSGRTWVTRAGVKVDRIASAWLILRFVDARARFRFLDPKRESARPGEITFDMVNGDYTHQGDRCTFETLLPLAGARGAALRPIAEIVHDIDLKDGKFGRPETRGIEQLLTGILRSHPTDKERLDRGFALFDELAASFHRKKPPAEKDAGE